MTSEDKLVQQIVVRQNAGTHQEVCLAVARASISAFLTSKPRDPAWKVWLAGPFTKTVRRTGPRRLQKLGELGATRCDVGAVSAIAFTPCSLDEVPDEVKKCQVSNFERPLAKGGNWFPSEDIVPIEALLTMPWVYPNPDVKMSTGKAAAQFAHAVWGWYIRANDDVQEKWIQHGLRVGASMMESDKWNVLARSSGVVAIKDAGLTEIDPGTVTMVAI